MAVFSPPPPIPPPLRQDLYDVEVRAARRFFSPSLSPARNLAHIGTLASPMAEEDL